MSGSAHNNVQQPGAIGGNGLSGVTTGPSEFLSIVAHDLRSPLSNIVSSASIALTDTDISREQLNEFLEIIRTSAEHLIHLVENLTDVNAIEHGRFKIQIAPCDLSELARSVADTYESKARAKQQEIVFTEGAGPLVALADPHPTLQIFDNLVSNAVKYSPKGKRIDIRLTRGSDVIRFEVQDEGPGLPLDDLKKMFGKFAKLSARPTGGEPSTGLGLSIVQKLVEATGGKVWCESEVGKGSLFVVELPAAPEA